MSLSSPIVIGLIVAIIVAILFFILFLVANHSKKKIKNQTEAQYKEKEQHMKESHEEALEKERVENKKAVTKQKEDFDATVSSKDREIDALKLFSKNHSEYVTDMRLIGIRERLVNEKRIRPEDMHIMANIFLPSNEFNNIERISHLVLTRTGLYIIDSQLLKGHVYNGISGAQFKELPTMSQVFQTLDLDESTPQTLVLDQNEDQQSLSFVNYSEKIKHIQNLAGDLQSELNTKYTPTSILYFNPKNDGDVTISNYNRASNVKVLVGMNNSMNSLINLYSMDVFNITWTSYKLLWIK